VFENKVVRKIFGPKTDEGRKRVCMTLDLLICAYQLELFG